MHHHGSSPDAYERLRFRVTWSSKHLRGVRRVIGLTRVTEVNVHRDGTSNVTSRLPGGTDFRAFTLDLGVPRNPEFEDWADKVMELGSQALPARFRQDMLVELLDEADSVVLVCRVHRCWVSERSLFPVPDEAGGDAIQRFRIENEGWTREE